jgi:hypothetical protein
LGVRIPPGALKNPIDLGFFCLHEQAGADSGHSRGPVEALADTG